MSAISDCYSPKIMKMKSLKIKLSNKQSGPILPDLAIYYKSRLLLQSHPFAIIVILDLTPITIPVMVICAIYPRIIMSKSHKLKVWSLTPR